MSAELRTVRIAPERWIEEFDKLSIKLEVRPLILKENARSC